MNRKDEGVNLTGPAGDFEAIEPELREALGDFKLSVDAWSEEMISRPREATTPARTDWTALNKWVLGCVVFAATVSSALYQNHKQVETARIEAARVVEKQRATQAAALAPLNEEDLMADIDSDVARQVPSALEPMATMMNEDETRVNSRGN
jgi:hypothetical protein